MVLIFVFVESEVDLPLLCVRVYSGAHEFVEVAGEGVMEIGRAGGEDGRFGAPSDAAA